MLTERRIEFMHWRRAQRWTLRDILCRLGVHWPRRWEKSAPGDRLAEELLCVACRFRIAVRPALMPLRAISRLSQQEDEEPT